MIYRDGNQQCKCSACGHSWSAKKHYLWWPISLHLRKQWFVGRHGIEIGSNGPEQKFFTWCIHLGLIRICFGPRPEDFKPKLKYVPSYGWFPVKFANNIEEWFESQK